jgi:hypothetical protein
MVGLSQLDTYTYFDTLESLGHFFGVNVHGCCGVCMCFAMWVHPDHGAVLPCHAGTGCADLLR